MSDDHLHSIINQYFEKKFKEGVILPFYLQFYASKVETFPSTQYSLRLLRCVPKIRCQRRGGQQGGEPEHFPERHVRLPRRILLVPRPLSHRACEVQVRDSQILLKLRV